MGRIYLDHSATTPVAPEVLRAMMPYFSDKFGNASSIHSYGQETREAVNQAREIVANFLNCKPTEIIFTSGGSESDNLAIKGVVESKKPHIITSEFEHHAVLDTVKEMEYDGVIEATYIKPDKEGIIQVKDIEEAIKENTVLVSIMYVNNEIGTVQPIREIGKMIERINRVRCQVSGIRQKNLSKIFFHTDAVQAAEYFNMDVDYLHVDMLTFSAHKIYGPKGVGVLYIRKGTLLRHQVVGGGQEYNMRAGTENVASIVGFGKAVELIQNSKLTRLGRDSIRDRKAKTHNSKLQNLRDKLIREIKKNIPDCRLNGSNIERSPSNVNFSFNNAEGESILLNLDSLGIAASSGSACTSGSLEPSHVLAAIGSSPEESHGSVRFTLGRATTEQEIDYVIKVLPGIINNLRKMSPFK